jgi:hypothetical protein
MVRYVNTATKACRLKVGREQGDKPQAGLTYTLGDMDAAFASIAAVVAWVFVFLTQQQFRARGKTHQLLWALGLGFFAVGITLEVLARAQGGWSAGGYRLWYWAGAMQGVSFLGQGTLHLLYGPTPAQPQAPWVGRSLELLLLLALISGLVVLNAPLDLAKLGAPFEPSGKAFAEIAQAGFASPRAWTVPFNLYGTFWLVGGALWSTQKLWHSQRSRALGTLLIALAGVLLASTSTLNRFGIVGLEALGRMSGVGLLFLGFVLTNNPQLPQLPALPTLPKINPLLAAAVSGWGLALYALFRLEPAAWDVVVRFPGLIIIAAILLGLLLLVLQKAKKRIEG